MSERTSEMKQQPFPREDIFSKDEFSIMISLANVLMKD
jgi:hypothetical protein